MSDDENKPTRIDGDFAALLLAAVMDGNELTVPYEAVGRAAGRFRNLTYTMEDLVLTLQFDPPPAPQSQGLPTHAFVATESGRCGVCWRSEAGWPHDPPAPIPSPEDRT